MATGKGLSPILEVAKEILSEAKPITKGLHVNEIAKIAASKNKTLGFSEEIFAQKIASSLAANLKTKKPIFSKPTGKKGVQRKGIYTIRRSAVVSTPIVKYPPPPINTNYSGKAGEYAVASELLFWGFNVSAMAVDEGIDLIAEKNGKFSYIQVKTSASQGGDTFSFSIDQRSFDKHESNNPWYIFVMRDGSKTNFSVTPHQLLSLLRNNGVIAGKNLSIQITRENNGRRYKMNGFQDINPYINNFKI